MTEARTVLRLSLGDDFTELTPDERDAYIDDWIQRYLEPELQKLDKSKQHCAGQDYARHRDFSFILPFYIAQDLRRIAPFVIEMHKVPSRLQQKFFGICWIVYHDLVVLQWMRLVMVKPWQKIQQRNMVSIWCIKSNSAVHGMVCGHQISHRF
jgi:phage FluMu gp28-like protein